MTNHRGTDPGTWNPSNSTPWLLRVLNTPLRSHVASGVLAGILVASMAWLWFHPESLAGDRTHQPELIADATNLVSNRQNLQNRFAAATAHRDRCNHRIDEIIHWLPDSRSWESIRASLRTVAASNEVQLISLDRGKTHQGARVAVISTRCEIHGTYNHICAFLSQLALLDWPIWCDEIRIVRDNQVDQSEVESIDSRASVECVATLSLRSPFAGKKTTAGKLIQRRATDES